jgi:NAD(P)-dependent dehydrogenase (short-subunit alcohol dehydrogenase family)
LFSLSQTGSIVTGGARGLGLCVAQSLLEAGSPFVYCVDILPSPAQDDWQSVSRISEERGAVIEYRRLDITDADAVTKVFEEIYDACPIPIAAFFGAAGIQQMVPALDYAAADFRRVMEVNVTGEHCCSRLTRAD